ncbi:hypothetical protein EV701_14113 [Chthoniobacter flavus]|nr:hypothetical protein EV701_14113 [Chthoniobacter flavus]
MDAEFAEGAGRAITSTKCMTVSGAIRVFLRSLSAKEEEPLGAVTSQSPPEKTYGA